MFERDFIKRLVEQLSVALARISRLRDEGEHQEALDEIDDLLGRLVPARHDLVRRLDPASAARMMRDRDTVKAYARLLVAEAEVHAHAGDDELAAERRGRALALYEEARRMGDASLDHELADAIEALRRAG